MELLHELKTSLLTILPPSFWDIIDIGLLAYLIYKLIQFMKQTRAGGLFKGIIVILGCYLIAKATEMKALTFIFDNALDVGILAIVILFQPELRRTLEKIGHSKIYNLPVISQLNSSDEVADKSKWAFAIDKICESCEDLSSTTTGALIVIERDIKLDEQIATGTVINAAPSKELLGNIFFKNTPLHDGAAIIRDGMIHAAACFLPKPEDDTKINKALGSRHRAAIGMSENSDAIIVVVSEETGAISIAENGKLTRGYSRDTLKKALTGKIIPEKNQKEKNDKKTWIQGTDHAKKEGKSIIAKLLNKNEKKEDNNGKE